MKSTCPAFWYLESVKLGAHFSSSSGKELDELLEKASEYPPIEVLERRVLKCLFLIYRVLDGTFFTEGTFSIEELEKRRCDLPKFLEEARLHEVVELVTCGNTINKDAGYLYGMLAFADCMNCLESKADHQYFVAGRYLFQVLTERCQSPRLFVLMGRVLLETT